MTPTLTVSCGCPAPGTPLLRELRGVVGVVACSGCGAELQVRLGAPPRPRATPTPRPAGPRPTTSPRTSVQAEGFVRVLASGRPAAHDAFVRSSFEHGRLAAAAACYRPLLDDPAHGLIAARALRQIATLALVPTMGARAEARTPASRGRRLLGHMALVLAGVAICLRMQVGYWQERIAAHKAAPPPASNEDARTDDPGMRPALQLPAWPQGDALAMGSVHVADP